MTEGNDASGTKILSEEDNGYCSLTSDGVYFYYYKLNDKHFYRYNTTTGEESDLMANFTSDCPVAFIATRAGILHRSNAETFAKKSNEVGIVCKSARKTSVTDRTSGF